MAKKTKRKASWYKLVNDINGREYDEYVTLKQALEVRGKMALGDQKLFVIEKWTREVIE